MLFVNLEYYPHNYNFIPGSQYLFYNVYLQIQPLTIRHTLVRDLPSSLLWMMLAALDQKLHSFHALTPPVITVHIVKMLVFSVCPVSILYMSNSQKHTGVNGEALLVHSVYENSAFSLYKSRESVSVLQNTHTTSHASICTNYA